MIRDAVRRLLTDKDIQGNARRIADDYARHDAPETSADLLESLAGMKATRGLRQTRDQRAEAMS